MEWYEIINYWAYVAAIFLLSPLIGVSYFYIKQLIQDHKRVNYLCADCDGEGWVCEDHPEVPWLDGDGCCGGAGMPCSCNPDDTTDDWDDIHPPRPF